MTSNTKDFPAKILEPLGIEAQTPDEFVLALVELAPEVVWAVVERQAAALRNPPRTLDDLLGTLENKRARPIRRGAEGTSCLATERG